MLKNLLDTARLSKGACASIIGVHPSQFDEWLAGKKRIPTGYARILSAMLGVPVAALDPRADASAADQMPGVWFRLRDESITDRDRTYIALIRRLAHLYDQFEGATNSPSIVWRSAFASAEAEAFRVSASPAEQGRVAARALRAAGGLTKGASGIASVLRGHLRQLGLMIVETPVPRSKIEGCSFYVQSGQAVRPCIFANTFSNTWFRRNFVICHETAHLVFDAMAAGASIDFATDEHSAAESVAEQRADAFAQEMLAPANVVRHIGQAEGIDWKALTPDDLAVLVAKIEVEARLVLKAAVEANLIDVESAERARGFDIQSRLEQLTERALPAVKYLAMHESRRGDWLEKRTTNAAGVPLRLPTAYVRAVVDAVESGTINWSKGAELLIVDRDTFMDRFGDRVPAAE